MIRIDLGKGDGSKGSKRPDFLSQILSSPLAAKLERFQLSTTTLIVGGVSLAVSCLLPLFVSQYRQAVQKEYEDDMKQMSNRIVELNSQIETYTPFKRELQGYEDQKKVVSDRLAVVRRLLQQRNTPVNMLDGIAQSIPQKVWLSNIELTLEGNAMAKMHGSAYSNEEISDLLDNLARSIYLDQVSLEDVSLKGDAKLELKEFNITAIPKGQFITSAATARNSSVPPNGATVNKDAVKLPPHGK